MGWSQHQLGGGAEILSLSPIYADNEDRVYFYVRRSDDTGIDSKEYLEVLETRYFSAKNLETNKPVYADCYIDILHPTENATYQAIVQAIKDDSSVEFRLSCTS